MAKRAKLRGLSLFANVGIAEAYLKEKLPLFKQRFDEQNIDYDELNQRERREQNREQNRKKGQENE